MRQITLPNVGMQVETIDADTRALVLTEITVPPNQGDVYVIPMPNAVAEQIGSSLSAPHIKPASPADLQVIEHGR